MNPRILELMIEAGINVEALRMYPGGFPREDLIILQDLVKLAVHECIDVALKSSHREDDMGAIIANNIKRHFGVEQ